jgi:tRNA(fMet)-specific endonuclease VapC
MPRYLLDTNIYIGKNQPVEVRQKFKQLQANDIAISVITYGELRYGAQKSHSRDQALKVINQLTPVIQILPLDENAGVHYGEIHAELADTGQIIGSNDLWITVYAKANNLILVSNNMKEFERVSGLQLESWVN